MGRWTDHNYLRTFQLAQEGLNNRKIASVLGVTESRFGQWVKDKPALKDALVQARGKNKGKGGVTFRDFIVGRLPKRLNKLWKQINECHEHGNGLRRTEALFRRNGEDARKHLFVYALTSSVYNVNEALKRVGITLHRLKKWQRDDPDFADMILEIEELKDHYFESKLIERVEAGDSQATMMAARTRLKHKGYSDNEVNVKVSGEINHQHSHLVGIQDLGLDTKTLRIVLKAIKNKEIEEQPIKKGQTLQIPNLKGDEKE